MSGRCAICQERFEPTEIAALKCGHTFHFHCVSQWLETKPSCPACRRPTKLATDIVQQLFFDNGEDSFVASPCMSSASRILKLTKQIETLEQDYQRAQKSVAYFDQERVKANVEATRLRKQNQELELALNVLKRERSILEEEQRKSGRLLAKNETLKARLDKLQQVERLVKETEGDEGGSSDDFDEDSNGAMKVSLQILKKKIKDLTSGNQTLTHRLKESERQVAFYRVIEDERDELKEKVKNLTEELTVWKSHKEKAVAFIDDSASPNHTSTPIAKNTRRFCQNPDPNSKLPSFVETTNLAAVSKSTARQPFTSISNDSLCLAKKRISTRNGKSFATSKPFDGLAKKGMSTMNGKSSATSKPFNGLGGRSDFSAAPLVTPMNQTKVKPTAPPLKRKAAIAKVVKGKAKKMAKVTTDTSMDNSDLQYATANNDDDSIIIID